MEKTEETLRGLAEICIRSGIGKRPENEWLKEKYEDFRRRQGGIRKAWADERIYRAMYGKDPQSPSDTLKIRYWRTGLHQPINREQCVSFGRALELSEADMRFLLQGYFDHSDCVFETEEESAAYRERRTLLTELVQEYLHKLHPVLHFRLYREGIDPKQSLRHIYYSDAKRYLHPKSPDGSMLEHHMASISYESEFRRQMKLLGEIPRRVMIRHILIFSAPYISRGLLSRRLASFGYLPLEESHTQTDGSRLDMLILGFLKLYEETCTGKTPETCAEWLRRSYVCLDGILKEQGAESLRIFYFKAIR